MSVSAVITHSAGTASHSRRSGGIVVNGHTGSSSTHTFTGTGKGIRLAETKITGVTWTHSNNRLSKAGLANELSFLRQSLATFKDGSWTQSTTNPLEYYYTAAVKSKPAVFRSDTGYVARVEGTVGSLADGQWGYGDNDTIGSNRIYFRKDSGTPVADCVWGDGNVLHIVSDGNEIPLAWYDVLDVVDVDTIELTTQVYGSTLNGTVTVYTAVKPWTDLEYIWSTTAGKTETFVNVDKRLGMAGAAINSEVGYGPQVTFLLEEGFGTCAIGLTINDLANGDTATTSITVTETAWNGLTRYMDTGGDNSDGTTLAKAWTNPTLALNWLRTASAGDQVIATAGQTFDQSTAPTLWTNSNTADRRLKSSVAGTKFNVTITARNWSFISDGTGANSSSHNLKISDMSLVKTGASSIDTALIIEGDNCTLLRCNVQTTTNGCTALQVGSGFHSVNWCTIADCTIRSNSSSGGAGSEYCIYGKGAASTATGKCSVFIGNYLDREGSNSDFGIVRTYRAEDSFLFNWFEQDAGTTGSPDPLLRFNDNTVHGISDKWYVYGNAFEHTASYSQASECITHVDDISNAFDNVLIDSNSFKNAGVAGCFVMTLRTCANIVFKNNVILNYYKIVELGSGPSRGNHMRCINNSWYSTRTGANEGYSGTGTAWWEVLKIYNEAIRWTANNSSSKYISDTHANNRLVLCHVIDCTKSFNTAPTISWELNGGSGGFGAGGWVTKTRKSLQDQNNTATNPSFTDPANGDFSIGVGSPCVTGGYFLPTLSRTYNINQRDLATNDAGAYEYGSSPIDPEDPPVMTMGSLAARFRCAGLRR